MLFNTGTNDILNVAWIALPSGQSLLKRVVVLLQVDLSFFGWSKFNWFDTNINTLQILFKLVCIEAKACLHFVHHVTIDHTHTHTHTHTQICQNLICLFVFISSLSLSFSLCLSIYLCLFIYSSISIHFSNMIHRSIDYWTDIDVHCAIFLISFHFTSLTT